MAPPTGKPVAPRRVSIELYLRPFPEPVRELTNEALDLIHRLVPELDARVYPGWKLIGLRVTEGKKLCYVGYLYPTETHLMLGFEYGTMMADPEGLLKGAGSQVRSIELRTRRDLREKRLAPYILEAVQIAFERKARRA
jgi:hypothetical protein